MFKNVIVRRPCRALVSGITSSPELGTPDYEKALKQHDDYINAMKQCHVEVTVLEANEAYPDSCFVEDTAVITRKCAIITNPGTDARRGEALEMLPTIRKFFPEDRIEYIQSPGTLEGGDVMMVGDHFYVGLSDRTNQEGIRQFISILNKYGLTGSAVPLTEFLHLKTGVNYIENNNLLVTGEFIDKPEFANFNKIIVSQEEAYASNCIWMNDYVIVPEGYPNVLAEVQKAGYKVIIVDTSEYRKIDGGLSCLSLRF
jgi:dimethylargininase